MRRSKIGILSSQYSSHGSLDPDSEAWLTATSLTGSQVDVDYIEYLVTNLKAQSLWTPKHTSMWAFPGNTYTHHKFNAVNPLNTDAAFRLTASGLLTHSATGMVSAGGSAITHVNPSLHLQLNTAHISFYSRTNIGEAKLDFGTPDTAEGYDMWCRWTDGIIYTRLNRTGDIGGAGTPNSLGLFTGSREANNIMKVYRNGVLIQTNAGIATGLKNEVIEFFRRSPATYSTKECCFASVGPHLTAAEEATRYTIIQAAQVIKSRNV